MDKIPYNNLTVCGSWGWSGLEVTDQAVCMAMGWYSWERALQIMAMSKINLKPIITRNISLDEWRDAFGALEAKQEIKVMLYPNEQYKPA
jgi:threonine dehydrogenase-like Zn-dependent dehydrogenase